MIGSWHWGGRCNFRFHFWVKKLRKWKLGGGGIIIKIKYMLFTRITVEFDLKHFLLNFIFPLKQIFKIKNKKLHFIDILRYLKNFSRKFIAAFISHKYNALNINIEHSQHFSYTVLISGMSRSRSHWLISLKDTGFIDLRKSCFDRKATWHWSKTFYDSHLIKIKKETCWLLLWYRQI